MFILDGSGPFGATPYSSSVFQDIVSEINSSVLVVDGLRTFFQQDQRLVRAVEDVSFSIPEEGLFGIAGESGSGKTQTALAIAGLVRGTPGVIEGDIWVDRTNVLSGLESFCSVEHREEGVQIWKDVSGWRHHRERQMETVRGSIVSMVFQEPKGSLSPYFTVGEQARETVSVHFGASAADDYQDRVHPLLEQMGFRDPGRVLDSYPHELSGGQCQRVMLALSLVADPDLLIADEPTTLLDAITEEQVLELFGSLVREKNLALLLITHDLGVMTRLVDQVAIMQNGTIVEQGTVSEIMDGALADRHSHTRELRRAAERTGALVRE